MSVITTADKHLEVVREHVNTAIDNLSAIVISQCDGHDEYKEYFKLKLRQSLNNLLTIRDDLDV